MDELLDFGNCVIGLYLKFEFCVVTCAVSIRRYLYKYRLSRMILEKTYILFIL
jgi:hypothetical protein